jgi:hypothetical protein
MPARVAGIAAAVAIALLALAIARRFFIDRVDGGSCD